VILCGNRRRRSGGRVNAEPVAEPEVIARVVEELAARLLRAGRLPLLVDVGPEQVLGAEERAGRELEHQELIRRCPVGEAGRPQQMKYIAAPGSTSHSAVYAIDFGLSCFTFAIHREASC
jgi:hypothetical protein